jgi:hypothetical protein
VSLPTVLSFSRRSHASKLKIRASVIAAAASLVLSACSHSDNNPTASMAEVQQQMAAGQSFDAFLNLRPLAEKGNPEAQYELGYFYHMGLVGAADFTKARTWYLRAANQGNADAMLQLAKMNGLGQGGSVDKKEAVKWLIIAGNSHKLTPDVAAQTDETRAKLADELDAADLAGATDAAKAFQPKLEN